MNLHEITQEDTVLEFLKVVYPRWTWRRTGAEEMEYDLNPQGQARIIYMGPTEYRSIARRAQIWASEGRPPRERQ